MVDDDGKLKRRWINKRVNAEKESIPFNLTYDEYVQLVESAGLKSSNLGFTGDNYVLARYNDTGAYAFGNCRFITHKENMEEQAAYKVRQANKKPEKPVLIPMAERIRIGQEKQKERDAAAHPSYTKERNSQFGTFWITDGVVNKKWKDDKGDIPVGFQRGRK